jgi:hypothetical protein
MMPPANNDNQHRIRCNEAEAEAIALAMAEWAQTRPVRIAIDRAAARATAICQIAGIVSPAIKQQVQDYLRDEVVDIARELGPNTSA